MKLDRVGLMVIAGLAVTGILWATQGQGSQTPTQDGPPPKLNGFIKTNIRYSKDGDGWFDATLISSDTAKFKEVAPGASMAVISGDPDKGAHRTFTRFAPAASFPLHTHTSEMHIVVIKGAYLYKPEKGEEQRVGPGCYLNIAANVRHSSGGDAKEGALFFEESAGKFDLVPVEKEKK